MVDSKELRIGDWVRRRWTCTDTGREVVRDFQIMEIRKNGETLYAWGKSGNMGRVEELVPIPITPEILLKNGWVLTSGYYVLKDKEARLGWQPYGEFVLGYSLFPKKVLYVHELQNIMIDCGIKGGIEL